MIISVRLLLYSITCPFRMKEDPMLDVYVTRAVRNFCAENRGQLTIFRKGGSDGELPICLRIHLFKSWQSPRNATDVKADCHRGRYNAHRQFR
jgi:hypothetical protein